MKRFKKILWALPAVLVIIQFIRPAKNNSAAVPAQQVSAVFNVPAGVDSALRVSCYDCHSNKTHYPWYAEVQPVGWWLANHVSDGREELNFDEFGTYSPRRRFWKLNGIIKQLDEDEMPLSSYTLIHRDAILTPETKTLIVNWAKAMQDTMKNHYPADSLSKPQRKK